MWVIGVLVLVLFDYVFVVGDYVVDYWVGVGGIGSVFG